MANITTLPIRNGEDRPESPLKAIKLFCLECCGYQRDEVKSCTASACPLYCFRDGKNPYRKHEISDEQKAKFAERMVMAREAKKS